MKPIDRFLIENINKLIETPEYQKMLDTYNSWEDRIQSAFKGFLLFLLSADGLHDLEQHRWVHLIVNINVHWRDFPLLLKFKKSFQFCRIFSLHPLSED